MGNHVVICDGDHRKVDDCIQKERLYVIVITTDRTTNDGGAGRLSTRRSTRDRYVEREDWLKRLTHTPSGRTAAT